MIELDLVVFGARVFGNDCAGFGSKMQENDWVGLGCFSCENVGE